MLRRLCMSLGTIRLWEKIPESFSESQSSESECVSPSVVKPKAPSEQVVDTSWYLDLNTLIILGQDEFRNGLRKTKISQSAGFEPTRA